MKIKKALAVILASTTIFSMTPGTAWAAEELSEEVVIEDEAVSDLEEPETDIEEIQDESDDTEAEVDAFSDEETTEKQLENNEALESASLFSDTEEDTIAVGISGKIVANGTDPWNKDVTWTLYDDGELVFDGSGTMEDYTESKLPAWYQYREKVTSVVVNDGIQNIGEYTFYDLYKLKFAKIGAGCSKTGGHVFEKCTNLVSVELPEGMTSIGQYMFTDCSSLTDIDLPEGISNIAYQAFRGCSSLKKVIIPDKVTIIHWNAFQNCSSLEEINIPDRVTEIQESAFSGCSSLKKIDIPESVTNIDFYAFKGCNGLESIEFPGSLTNMGWNTISGCENLKRVKFADGFRSIAPFNGCPKLTEIIIPDTVTAIGNITNCTSLESIYIPEGVNYVGSFGGCSKLRSVRYAGSETSWNALNASVDNAKVYYNYDPNHEHSYELTVMTPNTCTTNGTGEEICTLCGEYYEEIIPASHTWDEGKVTTTATCTEAGVKTYTCTVCNETKTEEISATGHQHTEIENKKDATCSEAGYTGDQVCKDCGTVIEKGTAIAKKNHTWDDGEVTTPATCEEKGEKIYICTVCNETKTEEISATGHQHTEIENKKDSTCSEAGYTGDKVCKDCNTVIETGTVIAKKGHTWNNGEVTEKPTCEEVGVKTYTCANCGNTKTEDIPATGHTEVKDAAVEATCEKSGLTEGSHCSVCEKVLEAQKIIPATGHKWNTGEITKEATCEEKGEKTYTCANCGNTTTEEIPATGHTEVKDEAVEATCEKDGLTEGSHCSVCGKVLEEQKAVLATGHSWNAGEITKKATCEEVGVKTYTCANCGNTKTEDIPATGHTEVKDAAVEATCEKSGLTEGSHCSVCEKVLEAQKIIPATGHKWNTGEITKEATCEEKGEKTYTCANCGNTTTEEIPVTGHTEVKDKAVEATCEKDGLTEGSHCSVCKKVLKAQETIPSTGHKFGAWKTTHPADVFSVEKQSRSCSECGKEEEREVGSKLEKTITVSVSSFPLKMKQKTKVLKVTGLADGDSIVSWKSSNTKIVKVSGKSNGTSTITAGKKTGKARITITLKSGLKKVITVSVQKNTVKTKKISGVSKNLKLKRKQKVILHPVIAPLTSAQKITYKSNNTKIVTVNSKGQITAKKKGTAVITVKSGNKTTKCKVTVK